MAQQRGEMPPPMTVDRAKTILKDTIQTFVLPENRARLQQAINECLELPPEQQQIAKMQKLIPIVTELAGSKLAEHGLPNVMFGVMQLQQVAKQDPLVGEGIRILTSASMGNPVDDSQLADYLQRIGWVLVARPTQRSRPEVALPRVRPVSRARPACLLPTSSTPSWRALGAGSVVAISSASLAPAWHNNKATPTQ
eukprot:CAMPEP_0197394270 /NCGR_PEP_ID=MMETSP1165-20131217/4785_1 /TAXON_ID=284809 /ORGANISM="Chrysocystis fragilis, Strain CCMP3189" /LENGTH=195 /DNA_ID=CAMNT_0042919957 /DNA_START=29 /DNA_END=617 /DNA_ORIENTATION=-